MAVELSTDPAKPREANLDYFYQIRVIWVFYGQIWVVCGLF